MKTKKFNLLKGMALIVMSVFVTLSACKKEEEVVKNPPAADFSANKTTILTNGTVVFSDLSTNTPTSWEWTFTGGTPATSTEQNPTVTYSTAGTYEVKLKATNADGSDTKTTSDYITVTSTISSAPTAEFIASKTSINKGETISFTDLSTGLSASWYWTFTGGTPSYSDEENPTVTYNTPGTYQVTLSVYNGLGNDTETKTAYITVSDVAVAPTANFIAYTTSIEKGGSITFYDSSTGSPTSWAWTFTGGSPSTSTSQNPTVTYSTAGSYAVTLKATNATGNDTETKTAYITVTEPAAQGTITCKIDGTNFVGGGNIYLPTTAYCIANYPSGNLFNITSYSSDLRAISLSLAGNLTTGSYTLGTSATGSNWAFVLKNTSESYLTDVDHTGSINLTKFDIVNRKASGTFSFTGKSTAGVTSTVTDGVFTDITWPATTK